MTIVHGRSNNELRVFGGSSYYYCEHPNPGLYTSERFIDSEQFGERKVEFKSLSSSSQHHAQDETGPSNHISLSLPPALTACEFDSIQLRLYCGGYYQVQVGLLPPHLARLVVLCAPCCRLESDCNDGNEHDVGGGGAADWYTYGNNRRSKLLPYPLRVDVCPKYPS